MSKHHSTITRKEVLASTDVDWLYEKAADCDAEPAEPNKCASCLAYMRAQEIELKEKVRADLKKEIESIESGELLKKS